MFGVDVLALAALLLHGTLGGSSGPEPPVAAEVAPLRIGLLGADDAWAERIAAGATQALEEWNAANPDLPLELVRLASARPWREGGGPLARMIVASDVRVLIGPSAGDAAHVAAQVATRLRVPILTLSSEESLTTSGARWIFRAVPTDREQAVALLRHVLGDDTRGARVAVRLPDDPRSRERRERDAALASALEEVGAVRAPLSARPDVLLLWTDAPQAAEYLERQAGALAGVAILGSLRLNAPELLGRPLPAAASVYLPLLTSPGRDLGRSLGREALRAAASAARSHGPEASSIRAGLAARGIPNREGGEPSRSSSAMAVGCLHRGALVDATACARAPSR